MLMLNLRIYEYDWDWVSVTFIYVAQTQCTFYTDYDENFLQETYYMDSIRIADAAAAEFEWSKTKRQIPLMQYSFVQQIIRTIGLSFCFSKLTTATCDEE